MWCSRFSQRLTADASALKVNSSRISTGPNGHITEFKLKENNFNVWVERFELHVILNEINEFKKK